MNRALIAGVLALYGTSVLASSIVLAPPAPLLNASVMRLEMEIARGLIPSEARRQVLLEEVRAFLGSRLEQSGIEIESPRASWIHEDRARYENTGAPHHRLQIGIQGSDDAIDDAKGFEIDARLEAEFLTPEYESVETFSAQRTEHAAEAELEVKVLSAVLELIDEILDFETSYLPPEKKTLALPGGALTLDLIPPGYGDLMAYYRHQFLNLPGEAALFTEPRDDSAEPLATYSLLGAYPPTRVLVAEGGLYLVAIHQHVTYRRKPHIVIYRADGSIVRQLAIGDLLSKRDRESRRFLTSGVQNSWPWADHSIDNDRDLLVFSLPTGHHFGGAPKDRVVTLEIDLATGQPIHPPRDYLPHRVPRVTLARVRSKLGMMRRASADAFACRPGRSREREALTWAVELPFRDLLPDAEPRPMPRYTEIGRKVRITGRVELELLIDASGQVVCAGITKSLPLGLAEEAQKAVLHWRLTPLSSGGGHARSHVAFDFEMPEIQPEPVPNLNEASQRTLTSLVWWSMSSTKPGSWQAPSRSHDISRLTKYRQRLRIGVAERHGSRSVFGARSTARRSISLR